MSLQRFRLVAVDRGGAVTAAYIGTDAAAAEKAFEKESANGKNEGVRLVIYPTANRTRFPATESAQTSANTATRRIGLETELEAAISAQTAAQKRVDEWEGKLKAATESMGSLRKHLSEAATGKARTIHSPESIKAAENNLEQHQKAAAKRLETLTACTERVKQAQAALKAFDSASNPKN